MRLYRRILIALFAFLLTYKMASAGNGDTTIVTTHNQVIMVTNPNSGSNPYPAWGVFPSDSVQYRKVILHLDYHCPPGMACGEWDYIDWVYIRRKGGVASPSQNVEFARYITPYGNGFTSSWHAEWHLDVTDYANFFHDSVEIEYIHTGYETNVGKGWMVNVSFELIEGTPVMPPIKMTQLWNGSFIYGDANNPIENHLQADTVVTDSAASTMRLRILQSGHGNDASGCSEFCSRVRYVHVDGNLVGQRSIWRNNCGLNPIYPQGGTWIYNRGNWCPGGWVYPDAYDYPVAGSTPYVVDMDMQNYTTASPSGNYAIDAQMFEFGPPSHANDASIEEVYSPNDMFEYSRMNPVCDNPKLNIRNNGSNVLTSATINYGLDGQTPYTYAWTGSLATGKSVDVILSGVVTPTTGNQVFKAYLSDVNGVPDEYNYDDTARTDVVIPSVYDSAIVLLYKTNNQPSQNSYTLKNSAGVTLYSKAAGSLLAGTIYRDTFYLSPGCYRFTFNDSGNDGLSWWANTAGGTGYARMLRMNGSVEKYYNADFGSQIFDGFSVTNTVTGVDEQPVKEFKAEAFPNPTLGPVTFELALPSRQDVTIEVFNSMGQVISNNVYKNLQHDYIEMDFSNNANGIYYAKIYSNDYYVMKEIMVSK